MDYILFMALNKDFKNCKTNRLELDDLQNTDLYDSSFKMIYFFKRSKFFQKTSKNTTIKS